MTGGHLKDPALDDRRPREGAPALNDGPPNDAAPASARAPILYCYRFGTVEFDEARAELRVAGQGVALEQKPLQVLALLLRHPGEVVTREELFDIVWAGRQTVDNVLPNALAKLRKALGPANAACIATLPRVGYRLEGTVERIAAGRRHASRLDLQAGQPVPGRPHLLLQRQLGASVSSEVWLARHPKTGKQRVYKFSPNGEQLAALKREATIFRVLRDALGERRDFVAIIDWNFDTAPFYLECEYGGQALVEWAGGEAGLASLSLEDRLRLFLQAADAVAAAHDVGVLHKDLKPSNVLVSPADTADGLQVRIADFGSSRLLEPGRLEALGITALGLTMTQAMSAETSGTVLYLAPELLAGQVPTVQSDLYSLGLILYQLVTGDLRRPLAPGWEQDVSDVLLREDIAAATHVDPRQRLHSVGELCERLRHRGPRLEERAALEAARARAREAERALEIGRARRPWVRVAGALLVVGLGVSLWQYQQAERARDDARRQAAIATAVNRFMTEELIGAANPAISGRSNVTVVEAVRAARPRIDNELSGASPEIRAALHLALQIALAELSDPKTSAEEGRKAIGLLEQLDPPDPGSLLRSRIWLAFASFRLGQYRQAAAMLDQVERELPGVPDPDHALQLRLWHTRSVLLAEEDNVDAALEYDRKAWALFQTLPPGDLSLETLRDQTEFNIAEWQGRKGETQQSEATLHDLIRRQTARLGAQDHNTLYSQVLLANTLMLESRFDEARALLGPAIAGLTQSLGASARHVLLAKGVLAFIHLNTREYASAARLYAQINDEVVRQTGEDNQTAIATLENEAVALHLGGNPTAAEPLYRRSLAAARRIYKPDNPVVQHIRYHLAQSLLDRGRSAAEARRLLQGLDISQLNLAERSKTWTARLALENGRALLLLGKPAEALPLLREAERYEREHHPDDPNLPPATVHAQLAAAERAVRAGG